MGWVMGLDAGNELGGRRTRAGLARWRAEYPPKIGQKALNVAAVQQSDWPVLTSLSNGPTWVGKTWPPCPKEAGAANGQPCVGG